MKTKQSNKMEAVKHTHKWEEYYVDCPQCGLGKAFECSCGELRESGDMPIKPKKR